MTPSEQAWVRIELPVTLEASQGFWEAEKKKAFCTGRTDVATVVPGMMAWILDMMCACVRLSASLRLSVEPSLHPQQINHCHISTDGTL